MSHLNPRIHLACCLASLLSACGSSDGPSVTLPAGDGEGFLGDPHRGGASTPPRLLEMTFGRLVVVHDVDALGRVSSLPVHRDFVINENLFSDGTNYTLETNPLTHGSRLIIHRTQGAPNNGQASFESLLRQAERNLPNILPKSEGAAPPFSLVARNACLVLRFDDVLDDSEDARRYLNEMIRVSTGAPNALPLVNRILFDTNHGANVRGEFHTTRVLVDFTTSEVEVAGMTTTLPLNLLGLPASDSSVSTANIVVRIPTRESIGIQTRVLRGLGGAPLDPTVHGPADLQSPTRDVVRAMRSGNRESINGGFLLDLRAPEIAATWPVQVIEAVANSADELSIDLSFTTHCRRDPRPGDILSVGQHVFEVTETAELDSLGDARGVRMRVLTSAPVSLVELAGGARYMTTYAAGGAVDGLCWLSVSPRPEGEDGRSFAPHSTIEIAFTEAMEPALLGSLEGFQVIRGGNSNAISSRNIVVGSMTSSTNLQSFRFSPVAPLDSSVGDHYIALNDYTDLSGNHLPARPDSIPFRVESPQDPSYSRGLVLRFERVDELGPEGANDLRGQFFFNFERGAIRPRRVSFLSADADRTNPVPSIMVASPSGPVTPLSYLGSKLQTVWRYADFGWSVRDESKYNIDVVGLSWSPFGGVPYNDYFDRFEIRLAHSNRLPDEQIGDGLLPRYENSGLLSAGFERNALDPQQVVHPKELGYRVDSADLFTSNSGTRLMPWPLNRSGADRVSYTWRDTSILDKGGNAGAGIPMAIETGSPLEIEPGPAGSIAPKREVPSFGLPLLMEFRCFPSAAAFGRNAFDVSLAVNSSPMPRFRVYSTGGTNTAGSLISVDPETENRPRGGFNPGSTPPGRRTRNGDNTFYIGQMDYVVRISRVHTAWFDTRDSSPDYRQPVLEPREQPPGTEILIDYRGATGFAASADKPFDARHLNAYGELSPNLVDFHGGSDAWTENIDEIDGARFLQMRLTFVNNIDSGEIPSLSALGIPYTGRGGTIKIDRRELR
ncbi:MAG: hypothetical protein CMJ89_01970 [Planctomycetes bacterium]|nr:hypothetical protein [Planctomycetota bacterium]